MVISAQWELVLGNTFGYTALSAFGMSVISRCWNLLLTWIQAFSTEVSVPFSPLSSV